MFRFLFYLILFYFAYQIIKFMFRVFLVKREIEKRYKQAGGSSRYSSSSSNAAPQPRIKQEDIIEADFEEIKEDKEKKAV
ncbi:MAG TPA: hypothetical protein VHP30_03970 [Ignavibacteriales bacterium]|nr:hypothetical protein [Ignavibacteriales bacterium]